MKLLNKYIKHRKNRTEKIIQAMNKNKTYLDDISQFVYMDTPNANMTLAYDQILSHLNSLIKENKIKKIEDQYYLK